MEEDLYIPLRDTLGLKWMLSALCVYMIMTNEPEAVTANIS